MRPLFDENLSPRLVASLEDVFPDSRHVRDVGLASASDDEVWAYAGENEFAIVSKDADFHQRSFLLANAPKVIWVQVGNSSTAHIEEILLRQEEFILAFGLNDEYTFLAIS